MFLSQRWCNGLFDNRYGVETVSDQTGSSTETYLASPVSHTPCNSSPRNTNIQKEVISPVRHRLTPSKAFILTLNYDC